MERLIQLLRENARYSNAELAARLGIGESEVADKIAALEKDGVLLGYNAIIDSEKGRDGGVTALVEMRITPETGGGFDRIAQRIAKYEQVRSCYLMSGSYDLAVFVEGRDLYDIARFVAEKLSTLGTVLSTATHFQLRVYKHDGFLVKHAPPEDRLLVSP